MQIKVPHLDVALNLIFFFPHLDVAADDDDDAAHQLKTSAQSLTNAYLLTKITFCCKLKFNFNIIQIPS